MLVAFFQVMPQSTLHIIINISVCAKKSIMSLSASEFYGSCTVYLKDPCKWTVRENNLSPLWCHFFIQRLYGNSHMVEIERGGVWY